MSTMNAQKFNRELKKGGAELLVRSLLEANPRHGYDVRKLIETRSDERRRRFYELTKDGRKVLAAKRSIWESFVVAINRVTGPENA